MNDISSLRSAVNEGAHKAREQRTNTVDALLSSREEKDKSAGSTNVQSQDVELKQSSGGEARAQRLFDDKVESIQAIISDTEDQLRAATTSAESSSIERDILEHTEKTLRAAEDALKEAKKKRSSGDRAAAEAFSTLLDSESSAKQADTSLQHGLKFGKEEREKRESRERDRDSSSSSGSARDRDD